MLQESCMRQKYQYFKQDGDIIGKSGLDHIGLDSVCSKHAELHAG